MPSILVVEQEERSAQRILEALSAEGWTVRVLPRVDQALRSAASEAPDLVVVSADVQGAEVLAGSFSRAAGGPGVIGLVPAAASAAAAHLGADELLASPFSDEALVMAARRALLARRQPSAAAPPPPRAEHKLTSHDIFGDVLAEVEGDEPAAPAPAPAAAAPPPPRPAPQPRPQDEDVNRRLEKTLSGMLGVESPRPRPAAPPPAQTAPTAPAAPAAQARRPEGITDDDVDALINKTLSTLDMGRTKPGPARPPAAAAPPALAPPVVSPIIAPPVAPPPPRPAPPPPAAEPAAFTAPPRESTGVRRTQPKIMGDFDFTELEELARTGVRKPEPPSPAPVPRPAAPPAPPAPMPRTVLADVAAVVDVAATQRIPVMSGLEDPSEPGERFGQYTLLERIAAGGMAEVWKARMRGVEGFQKTVAIKKILPHMTDNLEFISMFVDEAKLAAQLSHPNIVHIYDLGKIGREYYIAMEYVEGKDLRSLLNAARRKGAPLPLGLALLIAARLASALEYAHRKRDFEDRELGLVHRDVSPQNVLLTFEGDVKLCDFGIAKAVSKAGHTQMGALKGKLQYMSPEQAWGRPVDSRSDIFSLGVVTFEMITGEKLFPGDTEISVLEAVRQGRIRPPRQVNPAVPLDVEEIVLRAVAADPQDRFQSAGELKTRIESILSALAPAPSHTDLAFYIHRVLDTEPAAEPDFNQATPPAPAATATAAAASAPAPPPVRTPEPEPEPLPVPTPSQVAAPPVEAVAPLIAVVPEGEAGRKGRGALYAAIAALLILGVLAFLYFNNRKAGSPPAAGAEEVSPAPAAPPPGASAQPAEPAAAAPQVDIEGMVNQELAKREEALRRQLDEKQKKLEREVAAARAAGKPVPQPASAAATAAAAPEEPEPAAQRTGGPPDTGPPPATIPPPETRPEPEPPRAQESSPVPPPEAVRNTEPQPAPAPAAPRTNVGDLVTAGPGVTPPQLVSSPKPEYPPMARNLRVEGIVVVSVLVDENGRVQDVRVIDPIPKKVGINEAAVDAARRVTYKPATKEGVRVKMWTRLRIPFKL